MQIVQALAIIIATSMSALPIVQSGTAAATLPGYDRVRALQSAKIVPDVELIDQSGRPFSFSQLRGRVALVFFGFTNCPDVCPMAMQRLRQLEESGAPELDKVAYLMVSVDGERDTPEVLKAFLDRYSARFIGVTGGASQISKLATDFSAAFFKGSPNGGGYSVAHSPQVFVVDQAGRLRAEFYNASNEAMTAIVGALLEEVKVTQE